MDDLSFLALVDLGVLFLGALLAGAGVLVVVVVGVVGVLGVVLAGGATATGVVEEGVAGVEVVA